MIRIFDLLFSLMGILLLLPLFVIIYLLVIVESAGGGFYIQNRVGKDNIDFNLFKFRTMYIDSDKKSLITVGTKDSRLTRLGFFIRNFKLDELPQLFNVLKGDMSLVGPRPEVRKYVDLYNLEQLKVLDVRPGITDYASIKYYNENEILGLYLNPEKVYIEKIMPDKLCLNMKYILNQSIKEYFHLIFISFWYIIKKKEFT